ncbi:kinase-like domain-containing protein [Rhizophagus irregularis DAOM 181602=DAOM 197198]|nr:kinase-like domain-containing protein [Rhizophagus irregularis DAOM 181602=DAOM 197198]
MSNNTELINNSNECNWIEEAISKKLIKFYEFSQFYNLQEIGSGGFGKVYRADWKDSHKCCALKYFYNLNDAAIKAIVREIQHHREVDFYDNVIRFYGVTTFKNQIKEYSLVIEYADGGTLRDYLKENFENLTWKDKFSLAFQLHSNNILVHQNTVKLADFGLSKRIEESSSLQSKVFGMIAYVDPKIFNRKRNSYNNQQKVYSLNEKSDVYSIDFHLFNDNKITQSSNHQQPILDGEISKNIDSLPGDLSQVIQNFNTMNTKEIESSMSSSNQFEINFDTIVNDMININFDNIEVGKQKILTYLNSRNLTLQEFNNLLLNNQNDSNSLALLGDLNYLGLGISINEPKAFELYQKATDLGNSSGMCSLGYCYLNGIGTDIDNEKAFELYQKAADLGNSSGINGLGYCYQYGIGTDINKKKAYKLYQKAAELGNSFGINGLGYCYQCGIGTDIDKIKAYKLYQKAADLGNSYGINNLGYCYQDGIGTDIDNKKAFELYQKAADLGNSSGINGLGYCYQHGIGTDTDKKKAFELYQKAADLGNSLAQCNLANMYEYEEEITKNLDKAIYWYKKSAEQGVKLKID